MSWEDCGFKPGIISGPKECPCGACGDCDGEHHFYCAFDCDDDENTPERPPDYEPEAFFSCKHCGVTASMVDEDDEREPVAISPPVKADEGPTLWQ